VLFRILLLEQVEDPTESLLELIPGIHKTPPHRDSGKIGLVMEADLPVEKSQAPDIILSDGVAVCPA
jgi:hypothetical protein